MGQIAQTGNLNCTARAISTMRLALGYETGLPNGWKMGAKSEQQIIRAAGKCFPRHRVLVFAIPKVRGKYRLRNNIFYKGDDIPRDFDWDKYLVCFTYTVRDEKFSHMVIGTPALYRDMITTLVLAIQIEPER